MLKLLNSHKVFSLDVLRREQSQVIDMVNIEPLSKMARPCHCMLLGWDSLNFLGFVSSATESETIDNATWLFLTDGWQHELCRCSDCTQLLGSKNIAFIGIQEPVHLPEPDSEALSPSYDRNLCRPGWNDVCLS